MCATETARAAAASGGPIAAIAAKTYHVFLPRRLPGCDDDEAGNGLERGMFLDDMLATATVMQTEAFAPVVAALQIWVELQGKRGSASLLGKHLKEAGHGAVVPFLVFEQNALLLFERRDNDTFLVHACEVLPANAQAFMAQAVEWPVPQVTFSIPRCRLLEVKVQEKLVELANVPFADCIPTTSKRGVANEEIREPPFPRRLFEWLLPSLSVEVVDTPAFAERPLVKKLRHQVSFETAKRPWVRSVEWSAVKAVCHWLVSAKKGGRILYKCLVLRYMTELLEQGHQYGIVDNDLEHNMKAKLAYRARKLEKEAEGAALVHRVLQRCLDCAKHVKQDHDRVWASLSGDERKFHLNEKGLQGSGDTFHSVEAIRAFCNWEHSAAETMDWSPPVEAKPTTLAGFLANLRDARDAFHLCRALVDIENWVFATDSGASSLMLNSMLQLMKIYRRKAAVVYEKDPEGYSRMVVVLYRLAVFADSITVRCYPLAQSHVFELDVSILGKLLAPSRRLMEVVHEIEEYVATRNCNAPLPSLVSGDVSPESFAYRYACNYGLANIANQIQAEAQRSSEEKRNQVRAMREAYNKLMAVHNSMLCSFDTNGWHDQWCARCQIGYQAAGLWADVFEYPLPYNPVEQLVVVFELRAPLLIKTYRDIVVFVGELVKRFSQGGAMVHSTWQNHEDLQAFRTTNSVFDYDLHSTTKRFKFSHYDSLTIERSFSEEDFIKPNGATLRYGKLVERTLAVQENAQLETAEACTLQVKRRCLQQYVDGTNHVDSDVLAKQDRCPNNFFVSEFKAFGCLRAGVNIQLWNLCRAFVLRSLPFGDPDVFALIAQTMWQTEEPGSDFRRMAFREITNDEFVAAFVAELTKFLDLHKSSWEQTGILRVIITIGVRLFVMSDAGTDARLLARKLLFHARGIGAKWMHMATKRYEKTIASDMDVETIRKQKDVLVEIAAVTVATYCVDDRFVGEIVESSDDICRWVLAMNMIQAHRNQLKVVSNSMRRVIMTSTCMWDNAFGVGFDSVSLQDGCTAAIRDVWKGYSDGTLSGPWTVLYRGWLWTTFTDNDGNSSRIWLNLITGEFRVNSRTISSLPSSITTHSDFVRTFGPNVVLDSQPTTTPNEYVASYRVKGLSFRFRIGSDGNALAISYKTKDGDEHLLIPAKLFRERFPAYFSEFSHWQSGTDVKFRSPCIFDGNFNSDDYAFLLNIVTGELRDPRRDSILVNFRGPTAEAIYAGGISRMDEARYCHIWLVNGSLEVDLHRLGMAFEPDVIGGRSILRWKQNRDYYIASSQKIGCLIGLQFGLVLETSAGATAYRKLLLPGFAVCNKVESIGAFKFTTVEPDFSKIQSTTCPFFEFDIVDELKELKANTHESWLMLALLHALTTNVVEDPFTSRTGLDVCVAILRSARCLVNTPLSKHAEWLLNQITALPPTREFYPKHLKSMESVSWEAECLDYAASDDLAFLVKRIVAHSNRFQDYFKAPSMRAQHRSNELLVSRAHFRAKLFYNPETTLDKSDEKTLMLSQPTTCNFDMRSSFSNSSDMRDMAACAFTQGKDPELPPLNHHAFVFSDPAPVLEAPDQDSMMTQVWWGQEMLLANPSHWLMWVKWALETKTDSAIELALGCSWLSFSGGNSRLAADLYRLARLAGDTTAMEIKHLPDPPYHTEWGYSFNKKMVENLIEKHLLDVEEFRHTQKYTSLSSSEVEQQYKTAVKLLKKQLVLNINEQWPSPTLEVELEDDLLKGTELLKQEMEELWSNWLKNLQLHNCLEAVDQLLEHAGGAKTELPPLKYPTRWPKILARTKDEPSGSRKPFQRMWVRSPIKIEFGKSVTDEELSKMFVGLKSSYEACFERIAGLPRSFPPVVDQLCDTALIKIQPSRSALLRSLLPGHHSNVGHLRDALIEAGELCVWMQWVKRLVLLRSKRKFYELQFQSEVINVPHTSWDPSKHTEWLLLEVDCDFAIRPMQIKIARHLLNSSKSVATQLNMGEGKTHVIVPMLLATLSDKSQLAALTVLHQLLDTNHSALVQKLGGLLDKKVYHLPYSRDLSVTPLELQHAMMNVLQDGDVLITCPEYRLSAYLKALESPTQNMDVIRWTEAHMRHVVDESDEVFKVNFQLVYAKGAQQQLDADSLRWKTTAVVFESVKRCCEAVHSEFQDGIELACGNEPGSSAQFPRHFRITSQEAYDKLKRLVVSDLLAGHDGELGLQLLTANLKASAEAFLLDGLRSTSDLDDQLQENTGLLKMCLLLRGLLSFEVLYFVLSKRYRVEYGIRASSICSAIVEDSSRGGLAVPFRAKDVPSERADFGHPDVAICLTFLSYFYSGLSDKQMHRLLTDLKHSVGGEAELRGWLVDVPNAPRDLMAFNLVDMADLRAHVYPAIRFNQRAIAYYLCMYVFPREAKQFPHRLSASAWDLAQSEKRVLGFSGTNDTCELLPLQIAQDDLPELRGTNDLVDSYLCRDENNVYEALCPNASTEDVLDLIGAYDSQDGYPVQVLLDVGALLLDKTNAEVGAMWLNKLSQEIQGAVYFEGNQIVVLDRRGRVTPFQVSGLRHSLGHCVVYLDDSHTRGTDLPIPAGVRACVTVGSSQTRDRLVQGCMRMRLLEDGHRLMFVASHAVDLELQQFGTPEPVSPRVIVDWCRRNSSAFVTNYLTMWSGNGVQFSRKYEVMANSNPSDWDFHEDEVLELQRMYGMRRQAQPLAQIAEQQIAALYAGLPWGWESDMAQAIVDRVRRLSNGKKKFAQVLGEEQERQLEPEEENEQERELPSPMKPLQPAVHPFIARLARKGAWPPAASEQDAILSFPEFLRQTTAFDLVNCEDWDGRHLFVTTEFIRTVTLPAAGDKSDLYLRSPIWVVWLRSYDGLLISPFEVNALWSDFKSSNCVTLSLVAPRLRPGQSLMLGAPGFCVTPVHASPASDSEVFLRLMLAVGSLYFGNQQQLDEYIDFLGLCPHPRTKAQTCHFDAQRISMSGFVAPVNRKHVASRLVHRCAFSQDPTPLVRELIRLFGWTHLLPNSHVGELLGKVRHCTVGRASAEK